MKETIRTQFLIMFLGNCSILHNQLTSIKARVEERGSNYSSFLGYEISLPDLDFVFGDLDLKEKFLEWYSLEVVWIKSLLLKI